MCVRRVLIYLAPRDVITYQGIFCFFVWFRGGSDVWVRRAGGLCQDLRSFFFQRHGSGDYVFGCFMGFYGRACGVIDFQGTR